MTLPILFALLTTLSPAGSATSEASWVPVGPPGGSVRALASDPRRPQRAYLGTAEGMLYRSDDGGGRWERLRPGFPLRGRSLDELVVTRRGVLFVGYWEVRGQGGGVARSTDGGQHFTVLKGIAGESVRALAAAPSDPQVIAAGTLTGVFLSRDGGDTWARISSRGHAHLRNVGSLAFDPDDPDVLYAGTWHLAWKTHDAGVTWVPVQLGMIDDSDVMTLTFDRADPRVLYATACTGIYRSVEDGIWQKAQGIPDSSRRTRAFVQCPSDPDLLVAGTTRGLWMSRDRGRSWHCATRVDLVVNALAVQRDGTILAGTEEAGVLRSTDRGRTWQPSNTGFAEHLIADVLFDRDGERLWAAVRGAARNGGVFAWSNARGSWFRLDDGLASRQVLSLAQLDSTILAGTDGGIFARRPGAAVWSRLPIRVGRREVRPRVTDLHALGGGRILATTPGGLLLSADRGRSWKQSSLDHAEVIAVAVSPVQQGVLVAATSAGFHRTTDAGNTWQRISPALEANPHRLAFLPSDDRVLYATTTRGLYRSDDQGATWQRANGGSPHSDLTGIAVHPDGRTLYVSDFTHGGIFRSTDAGASWQRIGTEGLASDRVWILAVDPAAPDRLFAASSAGGLHLLQGTSVIGSAIER